MSKEFKFFITDFRGFSDLVNTPIRKKEDLINILLNSIKLLLNDHKFEDIDKGEISIVVNKTSRVYVTCKEPGEEPHKQYSFVFPFFIEKSQDNLLLIKCRTTSEILTSELIDNLLVLLKEGWFCDDNRLSHNVKEFAMIYMDTLDEYHLTNFPDDELELLDYFYKSHWSIIKTLLTFEPSYIRYDFDPNPDRVNEHSHPLNHLDVHYASSGSFKLGFDFPIRTRLSVDTFRDILENGKARDNVCYKVK